MKPNLTASQSLQVASLVAREATAVRDCLICEVRQDGASFREIARLAGLTPQGVKLICDRAGLPASA